MKKITTTHLLCIALLTILTACSQQRYAHLKKIEVSNHGEQKTFSKNSQAIELSTAFVSEKSALKNENVAHPQQVIVQENVQNKKVEIQVPLSEKANGSS